MAKNSAHKNRIGNAGKKRRKTGQEEEPLRKSIREKFTELLELPKELVLDLPKITMIGNGDMMIENYKSVMEYGMAKIRINTGAGIVHIAGRGLTIREITSEDIMISGEIHTLGFMTGTSEAH